MSHADPPSDLRRLLVGYDGSDAAGAAAAFALWLAAKAHAEATLLHVAPNLAHSAHAAHTAPPEALMAAAAARLDDDMEWRERLDALRSYAAAGAPVECEVVRGRPAAALLDWARRTEADMLMVGSTGIGAVRGAFLGSVSSQVVEHAPCSVMVFREGHAASPAHIRSVVVGADGSPGSEDAVAVAEQLAVPLGATLVRVTARPPRAPSAPPAPALAAGEVVEGRPREVLVDACERHAPAVLVVGSRGRGGFTGLLLGGTSRWTLNHAPCPVVVARRRAGVTPGSRSP
jgi:nucleotide-binding universal stress UspA family protein